MDDADRAAHSTRHRLSDVEATCRRIPVVGRQLPWNGAVWNVTEIDREQDAIYLQRE